MEGSEEQWIHKGPELPLPEQTESFGQLLLEKVRQLGDKTMLVDGPSGRRVSGRELLARSVRVALELKRRGVRRGDVVSVAVDNCLDVPALVLGALFIGAVYGPFNPDLHPDDLRRVLWMLEPRVAVVAGRSEGAVRGAAMRGTQVVALGSAEWEEGFAGEAEAAFEAEAEWRGDDPVCIMCSSGTTGSPKGALLSQRIWYDFATLISLGHNMLPEEVRQREVSLLVASNFWMSGLTITLMCILTATPLVVYKGFDVDTVLEGIQRHRATTMFVSPPAIAAIAKHPDVEKYDVSSLRQLLCAGASVSAVLKAVAEKRLKKTIVHCYGQTECIQGIFPGPLSPQKPTSVGTVTPNVQVKIVDCETGKILGPYEEGEIWIKSKMIFSGYCKNPEATASTLDADGWIHSGDVGYFDEEGYFYVCDRIKELIKFRGEHIAPAEVENLLMEHEGVRDAAVVGIEHEADQEHPVAFVVRQPGSGVSAQDLVQYVKERLPIYKQLHGGVFFIPEIPRTVTGKILRRELRQKAREIKNKL